MTRKKEAEEDRMEWLNGGKGKKRAVCCILVTHQGLETKAAPSASSSAPLILPNFHFSQEEKEKRFSCLTDGGRCQTLHMLSFVSLLSFLPGSSSSGGVPGVITLPLMLISNGNNRLSFTHFPLILIIH